MNRLIIILCFMPMILRGQNYVVYASVDFEGMTEQYLSADADTSELESEFSDFSSLSNDGYESEFEFWDSTKVMSDGGENSTKFLRVWDHDTAGIEADCFDAQHPPFNIVGYIEDSVKYDYYVSWGVRFSEDFIGGDAGGKVGARLRSPNDGDSSSYHISLSFQNDDTIFFWYYDDYDWSWNWSLKTQFTDFRWINDNWYVQTIRVDCGTEGNNDASITLYIDGICVDQIDGLKLRDSDMDNWLGEVHFGHFFGGGGCSPNFPVWVDFDDLTVWWPTPVGYSNGTYEASGAINSIGDTIALPIDFYCNGWSDCETYNDVTKNCDGGETPVAGRTDGVCAEVGGNVFFYKNGSRVYLKKNGINVEWNKN